MTDLMPPNHDDLAPRRASQRRPIFRPSTSPRCLWDAGAAPLGPRGGAASPDAPTDPPLDLDSLRRSGALSLPRRRAHWGRRRRARWLIWSGLALVTARVVDPVAALGVLLACLCGELAASPERDADDPLNPSIGIVFAVCLMGAVILLGMTAVRLAAGIEWLS